MTKESVVMTRDNQINQRKTYKSNFVHGEPAMCILNLMSTQCFITVLQEYQQYFYLVSNLYIYLKIEKLNLMPFQKIKLKL